MTGLEYLACVVIGFIAAVINVIAAGGSFLTLPLLLFLGFPAGIANGTNRVGVLAQNVSAVWGFHRHKVIDWRWSIGVSVPALIGAAIGVWGALQIPDIAFRRILSIVMLVMTLGTLLNRRFGTPPAEVRSPTHWTMVVGFFIVGLYGGFLQAGVGFLVLAVTTIAGLDLVRGNAVKVFSVMIVTLLSLAVFSGTGNVDWPAGIALGIGNLLGGLLGVRLAVLRGHKWLEHVVTATVIIFAVMLWVTD
ncbi:MAG TPA: sulfite exporter TauE/SafE family protein [Vicinamibacterales bacterium]|nr:sulfite exporter TauE/SafE family protein [Vicinamibacterales bacterium]